MFCPLYLLLLLFIQKIKCSGIISLKLLFLGVLISVVTTTAVGSYSGNVTTNYNNHSTQEIALNKVTSKAPNNTDTISEKRNILKTHKVA